MDTVAPGSPATKAFAIPELLEQALSFLESGSLHEAALVNKNWSDLALDRLWSHVPEIIYLIRVLHPLVHVEEFWDLEADSSGPNWERYNNYARRVRIVEYSDVHVDRFQRSYYFAPRVWALLTSRGPLPLGVHTIRWTICRFGTGNLNLPPLVHSDVKKLEFIDNSADDPSSLEQVFKDLSQIRGLQLEEFESRLSLYDEDHWTFGEFVAPFLATQTGLKRLTMVDSPVGYGPKTVQALLQLSALRYLSFKWTSATLMARINTVLGQLSQGCPLLQELKLSWLIDDELECPSFDFDNLLKWELQVLEISPSYPTDPARPSIDDIRNMGKSWPHLKRFKVNWANPTIGDESGAGLPLSSLSLFAALFPELEELSTILEWADDIPTAPIIPLSKLRVLPASDWYIPEENVGETAKYLKAMCPRGAGVLCNAGRGARRFGLKGEMQKRYEARRDRWMTVAVLMKGESEAE